MSKCIKGQKSKSTVGQGTHIPCSAMVLDYKMRETGNRAKFRDETMLQFTQVLIKKRQMGKWAVEGLLLGP